MNIIYELDSGEIIDASKVQCIKINFTGDCNKVYLAKEYIWGGGRNACNIDIYLNFLGSNSMCVINSTNRPANIRMLLCNNSACEIGHNNLNFKTAMHISDNNKVIIGDDNVFAEDVYFQAGDGHKIFDRNTHKLLNESKKIKIGDNNWICRHVAFLKDSQIKDGSVIGYGSLVTSKFNESNVIIAGSPAKIIRRNIYWKWL